MHIAHAIPRYGSSALIPESAYTLVFNPLSERDGVVHLHGQTDRRRSRDVGLSISDDVLRARACSSYPAIAADLIDLAAAIYTADRLVPSGCNPSSALAR
jgi:hypothetical protein